MTPDSAKPAAPPPDLFDQISVPASKTEMAWPSDSSDGSGWGVTAFAATSTAGVALLFHFPLWPTIALVSLVAVATRSRPHLLRRTMWVLATSAILAQITAAFVTPFSWPERLMFFAVMIGAAAFWYGALMDGYS
jgi:hypothetical protein